MHTHSRGFQPKKVDDVESTTGTKATTTQEEKRQKKGEEKRAEQSNSKSAKSSPVPRGFTLFTTSARERHFFIPPFLSAPLSLAPTLSPQMMKVSWRARPLVCEYGLSGHTEDLKVNHILYMYLFYSFRAFASLSKSPRTRVYIYYIYIRVIRADATCYTYFIGRRENSPVQRQIDIDTRMYIHVCSRVR